MLMPLTISTYTVTKKDLTPWIVDSLLVVSSSWKSWTDGSDENRIGTTDTVKTVGWISRLNYPKIIEKFTPIGIEDLINQ